VHDHESKTKGFFGIISHSHKVGEGWTSWPH
jgi:hypothetical protein